MKKIITIALCIIITCLIFCGCSGKNEVTQTTDLDSRFKIISDTNCKVIVDKDTGVMYLFIRGEGYRGGLTVMVDSDGKPLIYEGD